MTWKSYRKGEGVCEVCGKWKFWRVATKHGVKSVCPNSNRKDHHAA